MGKIIFLTGGTRSGKSQLAVEMAKRISDKKVLFVATCVPEDNEMKKRIILHKRNRPTYWKTIETKIDILKGLKDIKTDFEAVIIDCLTLFVSSLLMNSEGEKGVKKKMADLIEFVSSAPYTTIIVSGEVGAGIAPENKLAREFRDLAGIANQIAAKYADEVYFVVAGIPVKIKSED